MKIKFNQRTALFLGLFAPLTVVFSSQAVAQDDGTDREVEEVVVLGSRRSARSVTDSAVPVDVISGDDFVNQGDTDLSNLLKNVVPSYNVNTQPISDAATLVRPANLRGLAPDHTLVLVNGKRRHRAAVIYWLGNGVSDGAQGPDIAPLPAIALKQVEVLRDGAAAQYGSDAIAGVMNFALKDDSDGTTFEAKYGQFYEGDGATWNLAGNIGLPFTDDGFANFSFEYGSTDDTNRSIQRNDAAALIAAGNTAVANPAQVWGQPIIDDDLKLVYNIGLQLDDSKEFYAFGNYAQKTVDGGFFFRNPNTHSGVFRGPGVDDGNVDGNGNPVLTPTILTGDMTPGATDNSNCPVIRVIDNVPDASALAQLTAANCFAFNQMFPGGFTPRFGGDVIDFATTVGVRGETDSGWNWDLSGSYGRSFVDFSIRNTVNASLGLQTPTEFNLGDYQQVDKNLNFDISKGYEVGSFYSDLNVAMGVEYRSETFTIVVGDQASYTIGPYAAQGFSTASNGFPGFSPLAAGGFERSNYAAYVDFEADVTENFLAGVAFRFEDFEGFGSTFNGKATARYAFTDNFALRGAYSTGFRAPTPGQSNAFNVSTEFENGQPVNNGTVPSVNPVAQLRGGQPLNPEKSNNFTFGAMLGLGPVDLTIDYFRIELEDRIALSRNFSLNPDEVAALINSGVTSAGNLRNFRFFTNDYDTLTRGVDIVATYSTEIGSGNTDFTLSYNATDTEVTRRTQAIDNAGNLIFDDNGNPEYLIDDTRVQELEFGLPKTRWNIGANHIVGNWRFLGRLSYYDDFYDSEDGAIYGDEFIVDAEVAYTLNDNITLTLGAQNLLDEYPDENPNAAAGVGNQYSQFSPSGFGGGFYYFKLRYEL
ncbi:TonB-dependent receptor [hydrothermal vent metagenome]|uniref:TonB-dependent receptor n=1 Tax=hydrothermal vent metagenome TaxID=652676 RepID=A0A3B0URU6_9ZZZZ